MQLFRVNTSCNTQMDGQTDLSSLKCVSFAEMHSELLISVLMDINDSISSFSLMPFLYLCLLSTN